VNADAQRAHRLRLTPDRALDVLDDAVAFVRDRGVVTLTGCCSLPSLFVACHEEPHSPGKAGYGQYPKTRWWWPNALADVDGLRAAKVHRGKTVLLSRDATDVVDAIGRWEAARATGEAARVLEHLHAAGPSRTDELKLELAVDRRAWEGLERSGAVIARPVEVETANGGHRHLKELRSLVDGPERAPDDALVDLLRLGVGAAVVVPAREVRRWWSWDITDDAIDAAVEAGAVVRDGARLVAAT
jgi:hypothetical protein